mmetsp:Transcript_7647/g.23296  ORF Transcript_7647/g.23296 Transcript_7647/m.23296 type:complete len:83 (-) Transcript_7647:206-454(-)
MDPLGIAPRLPRRPPQQSQDCRRPLPRPVPLPTRPRCVAPRAESRKDLAAAAVTPPDRLSPTAPPLLLLSSFPTHPLASDRA